MSCHVRIAGGVCNPQAAAELFRVLAHPMRLQILCRLRDGEVSVAGLESELGLKQPSLSQQLGHLRETNLVTTRREGKSMFYRLDDQRVRAIVDALCVAMSEAVPNEPALKPQEAIRPAFTPNPGTATPIKDCVECGVFAVVGWPARG
jgi:DNA-binding transcriptional ArsR family regulator